MATPSSTAREQAGTILVVDDDPDLRHLLRGFLTHAGFEVLEAGNGPAARPLMEKVDAVLLDVMMPEESGLQVLEQVREKYPHLAVVMVTASHEVTDAVRAMKMGAFDYLLKPVRRTELVETTRGAVALTRKRKPLHGNRADRGPVVDGDTVFGSPAMLAVMETLLQVTSSGAPVLLRGESGVGKEVLARFIHRKGSRRDRPFVAVNCAALPRDLMETELFGHEAGAVTGGTGRRRGFFEEAADGTVFLDEVGDLDPAVQVRLLRVLQEREFMRVGGNQMVPFKARVVAASTHDMPAEVAAGKFRADLYYRLEVINVAIPPLRERTTEIAALAKHLLERFAHQEGVPVPRLTDDALAALAGHTWPGNVRELENVLRRAALVNRGEITALALQLPREAPVAVAAGAAGPAAAGAVPGAPEPVRRLSEHQAELMMRALQETRGNVAEAARRLGIGRATFYRRAKRWGLPI